MYSPPRATWTVMRIIWMQVALCTAIILEGAVFGRHGLARLFELTYNNVVERFELWQLLTTTLVHSNPFQLLFNALTLWMFGSELEQRWGRGVFIKFYAICAVGCAATFLILAAFIPVMRNDVFTSATGVNLGILIAYAIYWPERQIWFFFLFPVRMKFVALITGLIAIMYAVSSAPFALTAAGHVGGLMAAGIMLLISGGEMSALDRPFRVLADFAGRLGRGPTGKRRPDIQESGENLEVKIDAILDKISRGGMKSLSSEEKQFLRDASDRMNRTKH